MLISFGLGHEFAEAVALGEASGGEVDERTIGFDSTKENGHTPSFVDDVMDSEILRSFDTLVLMCYLVVL